MSVFSGPQGRGAMAAHRAQLGAEAAARGALTRPERRRAWRLATQVPAGPEPGAQQGGCLQPWKEPYENAGRARAALRRMPAHRKAQGLSPYPCAGGHFHLGREMRRAVLAWKAIA
jgi:hypothetical protein